MTASRGLERAVFLYPEGSFWDLTFQRTGFVVCPPGWVDLAPSQAGPAKKGLGGRGGVSSGKARVCPEMEFHATHQLLTASHSSLLRLSFLVCKTRVNEITVGPKCWRLRVEGSHTLPTPPATSPESTHPWHLPKSSPTPPWSVSNPAFSFKMAPPTPCYNWVLDSNSTTNCLLRVPRSGGGHSQNATLIYLNLYTLGLLHLYFPLCSLHTMHMEFRGQLVRGRQFSPLCGGRGIKLRSSGLMTSAFTTELCHLTYFWFFESVSHQLAYFSLEFTM